MTTSLACVEVVELVSSYLEGELDGVTAERVRLHLEVCEGCREYLEQVRATAGALEGVLDEHLDATVRDRLLTAFRDFHRGV